MTESLQLPNQPLRVRLAGSVPVEVILTELLIGHFTLQHVVADHQNRMPNCYRRFLGTMPTLEAGVLSREVGPFGTRGCVCRTDEGASEPLRAFASLA